MNANELIEELSKIPAESEVLIEDMHGCPTEVIGFRVMDGTIVLRLNDEYEPVIDVKKWIAERAGESK